MDSSEISRREALRLAKFGLLLGAGLCVASESKADGEVVVTQKMIKYGAAKGYNSFVIKLYAPNGEELQLLKSVELSREAGEKIWSDKQSVFTFKFWRPTATNELKGVTYATFSDLTIKGERK